MTLKFRHDLDPNFTTATDDKGRMYRVLLASGTAAARYYLKPWDGTKAVAHRGLYVDAGHGLHAAIDAAEKARPRPEPKARDFSRFAADFA